MRARDIPIGDYVVAGVIAVAIQIATVAILHISGGPPLPKRVPDNQPISVAIQSVVEIPPAPAEPLPALKLGSEPQPNKLPDMAPKPTPVSRVQASATPSTKAEPTPEAIPTTEVSDAGPPPPDAEVTKEVDPTIPAVENPAPAPVHSTEGAPDGVPGGTETDPLKAHAVSLYRSQLDAWFSSRFRIRGALPFDELKNLRAKVVVEVSEDRTVKGFRIVTPSGNDVFDEKLRQSLEAIRASDAELPPPPPMYPDILGQTLSLSFSCTNRRLCE